MWWYRYSGLCGLCGGVAVSRVPGKVVTRGRKKVKRIQVNQVTHLQPGVKTVLLDNKKPGYMAGSVGRLQGLRYAVVIL